MTDRLLANGSNRMHVGPLHVSNSVYVLKSKKPRPPLPIHPSNAYTAELCQTLLTFQSITTGSTAVNKRVQAGC